LALSGEAFLRFIGGTTTIILRRYPGGQEHRFTPEVLSTPDLRDRQASYPRAGFSIRIDLATAGQGRPLRSGSWIILLRVGRTELHTTVPLHSPQQADAPRTRGDEGRGVSVHVTRHGKVRLELGAAVNHTEPRRYAQAAHRRLRRAWSGVTLRRSSRRFGRGLSRVQQ
jgi:hypothetical protein